MTEKFEPVEKVDSQKEDIFREANVLLNRMETQGGVLKDIANELHQGVLPESFGNPAELF